ncbi:hypothetical protein [Streptomyces sp. NPDC096013]|uniref:hypothetical protein n=1 Tax=Streptomyces sp. NPDC096013 TaxID=3366069 RepID=UPI0038103456
MEETQTADQTCEPVTQAEVEQAGHLLRELARSASPDALEMSDEQLAEVAPFFELGWAMGVRTGHTAPAVAGVPVDQETVTRAFTGLLEREPRLWQKVDYHGSVTKRHGALWVCAIHVYADPLGDGAQLRYDLCEMRGLVPVIVVTSVRRRSLTPLPVFRLTR